MVYAFSSTDVGRKNLTPSFHVWIICHKCQSYKCC